MSSATAELVVARYGELWLKGKNRPQFERRLVRNLKAAVKPISPVRVERRQGQLAILPERRVGDVARRLQDVFGLASLSPAWGAEPDKDAIASVALDVMDAALDAHPRGERIPFRVRTKRADKRFPLISTELDRYVADRIMPAHGERLRVDLSNPVLTLGISVRPERAYVFAERLAGAGGLPVGTLGRALCLLSGGIDSPVAAWMAMKRGCAVSFLSFHSYPYIGESSKRKVETIARALMRFQPRALLYSAPFAEVQTQIRDHCREAYRTVLYRRMMQRIASRIAERDDYAVLVTGESLGQVASQTLENLTCIGDAAASPVLRPLVAFDKAETIELARRIGTFETSILPEPDCCTVFQPRRPVIRATPEARALLGNALERLGLTARSARRILRVGRTVADMAGEARVLPDHLAEALSYRDPRDPRGG